jgi:GntR family transcriptional regulator
LLITLSSGGKKPTGRPRDGALTRRLQATVPRFQLRHGPVPLHHQVYLDLRGALDAGEWRAGDQLPPERDLAARYGCSLITVRRALDELSREKRLQRTRGRGTFVLAPLIERDFHTTMSFSEEMRRRGLIPETRLVAARREAATEFVAEALGIEPGAPTHYFERLRLASGEPLLLEMAHLPAKRFPGLLASDLEHNSLWALLAERYSTPVARTREALEPVLLPAREARLLGLEPGALALLVEGVACAADGAAVELGRTYVRVDRTRYYIERVNVHAPSLAAEEERLVAARGG